jgi:hypothetical protein
MEKKVNYVGTLKTRAVGKKWRKKWIVDVKNQSGGQEIQSGTHEECYLLKSVIYWRVLMQSIAYALSVIYWPYWRV